MAISPSMRYLKRYVKNPKDLWKILDRTFGMIDEDHNRNLERIYRTIRIINPKISSSTLSNEVVQDEEEAEASTQSIQIEFSLLAVSPSPNALEVCEIYDSLYPHMSETIEDI